MGKYYFSVRSLEILFSATNLVQYLYSSSCTDLANSASLVHVENMFIRRVPVSLGRSVNKIRGLFTREVLRPLKEMATSQPDNFPPRVS